MSHFTHVLKSNPYHDAKNGRFTSGSNGVKETALPLGGSLLERGGKSSIVYNQTEANRFLGHKGPKASDIGAELTKLNPMIATEGAHKISFGKGKHSYAVPSPAHGEYRIYDHKGRYWMNASHTLLKNVNNIDLPPVARMLRKDDKSLGTLVTKSDLAR